MAKSLERIVGHASFMIVDVLFGDTLPVKLSQNQPFDFPGLKAGYAQG
jgi:hypothetical protein